VRFLNNGGNSDYNIPPKVAVILATHQPNSTIFTQINSIFAQIDVDVRIYWGDDRSDEVTRNFIRDFLHGRSYMEISDTSAGATKNFLHLLKYPDEDYIAFADQDDIWDPEKLIRHIKLLENSMNLPALSHSNSVLILESQEVQKRSVCRDHTFYDLSWQNCVQGCTLVINSKAQKLLNRLSQEHVVYHDWWIAQVVSLCGVIHFSTHTDTFYRIHSKNTIGHPNSIKRLARSASRPRGKLSMQILEILDFPDQSVFLNQVEVDSARRQWQRILLGGVNERLKLSIKSKRARNSIIEDLWRRVMLVFKAP
jgi:glycosyltransferase involved in cell wall biosynthesis